MRERSALAGLAGGSASSWENRFPGRQKKERFNWEEALRRETAIPFRAKHGPGGVLHFQGARQGSASTCSVGPFGGSASIGRREEALRSEGIDFLVAGKRGSAGGPAFFSLMKEEPKRKRFGIWGCAVRREALHSWQGGRSKRFAI